MKYSHPQKFDPKKLHSLNINVQAISLIPPKSKILEIGCADGFIGEYLINEKECEVVGVEKDPEAAKKAEKRGLKMIKGDIEEKSTFEKLLKFKKFEVILATSVIEHLKDPGKVLRELKDFLKEDGFLVVSTSNIVHWSARIKILMGKFEYEDYGLFDNTHLRFFTPKTFKKLIEDSGYKVDYFSFDSVGGGYPKISRFFSLFFPNLFGYQMLIKGVKNA